MLLLWDPELLLVVCGLTWPVAVLVAFLVPIPQSCERKLTPREARSRSKPGRSLVSWLASKFGCFPILVLPSLNPQLKTLGSPSQACSWRFLLIHCAYAMVSLPGLSIQGSVPASHDASDWQHLPGLQRSKLCQEFSASASRLQPSLVHAVCTLHFCLGVADLSYRLYTPRASPRDEITLGCQQVTRRLNRSTPCCLVL